MTRRWMSLVAWRSWELPLKMAADAVIVFLSFVLAMALRYDGQILAAAFDWFLAAWPLIVLLYLAVNYLLGIYRRWWRAAGLADAVALAEAVALSTTVFFVAYLAFFPVRDFPLSIVLIGGVFTLLGMGVARLRRNLLRRWPLAARAPVNAARLLIVGAGRSGQMLARELLHHPEWGYLPVCFVDDDPKKHGMRVHGLPVLGGHSDLSDLVGKREIDLVAIAIPLSQEAEVHELARIGRAAGARVQVIPGIPEIIDGHRDHAALREFTVGDLLDRSKAETHAQGARRSLAGQGAHADDFLPYCLPSLDQAEVSEVADTLRSRWITTGPKTKRFEADFAAYVGARHAVAVNSCTAGLHVALAALGVGPGDEVITTPFTFCASVNVIVHCGATPVLADISPDDLCIDPAEIRRKITPRAKAILPVHYAGQACRMSEIRAIAEEHGLVVVEDAAHAVGAGYRGRRIGTLSEATAFSFYATKNITTGEGGMVTTDDPELAQQMRVLSLHGISHDAWKRYTPEGSWYYEVLHPGFKYNMTDLQASLGLHQLAKLEQFLARRGALAARYDAAFAGIPEIRVPRRRPESQHARHLYVIQLDLARLRIDRAEFIAALAERKIGASVHFIPVHLHPWYRERYHYKRGDFPHAEAAYDRLVSLPLYPAMSDRDADDVIAAVAGIVAQNRL